MIKIVKLMSLLMLGLIQTNLSAQTGSTTAITEFSAQYDAGDVLLTYIPLEVSVDSVFVRLKRFGADGEKLLHSRHRISSGRSWLYLDTLIRKLPGIYRYELTVLDAEPQIPIETWVKAYSADMVPVVGNLRIFQIEKKNQVLLSWEIENSFLVESVRVLRSRKKGEDYRLIATLDPTENAYLDRVNDANEPFFYRIDLTVTNKEQIYQSASVHLLPDYAILPEKVNDIQIGQVGKHIQLTWSNDDGNSRAFYIQKRKNNKGEFEIASAAILSNSNQHYVWIDSSTTFRNQDSYQYRILAESNSFDRSDPSDTLSISYVEVVKALNAPQNLQLNKTSDSTYYLTWELDSIQKASVSFYSIYRKRGGDRTFELLNNRPVSVMDNYYAIEKPKNGDEFKVKSTNASIESSFSLPVIFNSNNEQKFGPKYLKAVVLPQGLWIKWINSNENFIKSYRLYKWEGEGYKLIKEVGSDQDSYLTTDYSSGQLNTYRLTAVDNQGKESIGSEILEVN